MVDDAGRTVARASSTYLVHRPTRVEPVGRSPGWLRLGDPDRRVRGGGRGTAADGGAGTRRVPVRRPEEERGARPEGRQVEGSAGCATRARKSSPSSSTTSSRRPSTRSRGSAATSSSGWPDRWLLSIGLAVLAVGFLRLLQGETGSTFTGNLSWIPYVDLRRRGRRHRRRGRPGREPGPDARSRSPTRSRHEPGRARRSPETRSRPSSAR